jgi:dTMP kinase
LALGRARARAQADRFESERAEFFERVRRAYLDLAQAQPGRFRIIDAAPALEQVQICLRQVLAREFT